MNDVRKLAGYNHGAPNGAFRKPNSTRERGEVGDDTTVFTLLHDHLDSHAYTLSLWRRESKQIKSADPERPATRSTGGLASKAAARPARLWSLTAERMRTRTTGSGTSALALYPPAKAFGEHHTLIN